MAESLNALLQASVWLAITVVLLAALRPLLLALGGAALVYRSWWCVPVLLVALHLPLPMGPMVDALPVLAAAVAWTAPVVVPAAPAWPWLLLLAWALGALGMGGASWRAQRRFERAMGTLRPRADGTWQASADPGLPALVGLWAPRIVVGPAFEADFSPAEQDLILQHERSHRRHGDPWANAVLALLRCVFWFHPLLPWAARRFLRDQELACDARTVDPHPALRRLYANALLKRSWFTRCTDGLPLAQPTDVEGANCHVEGTQAESTAVDDRAGAGDGAVRGYGNGGVGQPGRRRRGAVDQYRPGRAGQRRRR